MLLCVLLRASAASASAAAAAGLTAAAHEQQSEEETEKQAAEREAHGIKRQLDATQCVRGEHRAPCWKMLVPVLVPVLDSAWPCACASA